MTPVLLDSSASQVLRVSPPISASPPTDQFRAVDPNQLNVTLGMASLAPSGFEPPRYGIQPPVSLPFAQQTTSATSGTSDANGIVS